MMFFIDCSHETAPIWRKFSWYLYICCACTCLLDFSHIPLFFVYYARGPCWTHALGLVIVLFCIDRSNAKVPVWRKFSWYFYMSCSCTCLHAFHTFRLFGLLCWGRCCDHIRRVWSLFCPASIAAIKKCPSGGSFPDIFGGSLCFYTHAAFSLW